MAKQGVEPSFSKRREKTHTLWRVLFLLIPDPLRSLTSPSQPSLGCCLLLLPITRTWGSSEGGRSSGYQNGFDPSLFPSCRKWLIGCESLKAQFACLRRIYYPEFPEGLSCPRWDCLKSHFCLAASSFLSCFPYALPGFSEHFFNKSLIQESLSQGLLLRSSRHPAKRVLSSYYMLETLGCLYES